MTAMTFPTSPTVGQTYTSGTSTWTWTGTTWDAVVNVPNLSGGSAGTIPYQSAASTTAMLATGPSGSLLKSNGTSVPSWLAQSSLTIAESQVTNLTTDLAAKAPLDSPSLTGTASANNLTVSGVTRFKPIIETAYINSAAFAGYNFYASTNGSVQHLTTASTGVGTLLISYTSSTTLDSVMLVGDFLTVTLLITQGTTGYLPNAYTVDAVSVTPKWLGGTAPTASASATDALTLTLEKTAAATFTLFASVSKFA